MWKKFKNKILHWPDPINVTYEQYFLIKCRGGRVGIYAPIAIIKIMTIVFGRFYMVHNKVFIIYGTN